MQFSLNIVNEILESHSIWILHLGKNPGNNYSDRMQCYRLQARNASNAQHVGGRNGWKIRQETRRNKTVHRSAVLHNVSYYWLRTYRLKFAYYAHKYTDSIAIYQENFGSAGCHVILVWDMWKATVQLDVFPCITRSTQRARLTNVPAQFDTTVGPGGYFLPLSAVQRCPSIGAAMGSDSVMW